MTAFLAQLLQLFNRFHALGKCRDPEALAQHRNRTNDRKAIRIAANIGNK